MVTPGNRWFPTIDAAEWSRLKLRLVPAIYTYAPCRVGATSVNGYKSRTPTCPRPIPTYIHANRGLPAISRTRRKNKLSQRDIFFFFNYKDNYEIISISRRDSIAGNDLYGCWITGIIGTVMAAQEGDMHTLMLRAERTSLWNERSSSD